MKHFTKGIIIGRISSIEDEETKNGKKYITLQVDVSSTVSGDVTAYCRMYDKAGNIEELKRTWQRGKQAAFKLTGIYSQYRKNESSDFLSSFTLYDFDVAESGQRRAYFIVTGRVSHQPSGTNDGGQRFLVEVVKEDNNGNEQAEQYEFWAPGDKLLDPVACGDLVRLKGLVRQREPDGVCGGDGPIRAYIEKLEIVPESGTDEDGRPF